MEIEKNLSLVNKRIKASVISGVAEVVATHPIDYWKTVVQSNKSKSLFKQNPYRGVGVRLLGVIPLRVTFWNTLNYCREKNFDSVKTGTIVASVQTLLDYPLEQAKIQRMINNSSVRNAFVGKTVFPGFLATLGRNIGFAIVLNKSISQDPDSIYWSAFGGFAGALVTHPLDTLKTHFQHNRELTFPRYSLKQYFGGWHYRCSISLIAMGIGWKVFNTLS